MRKTRVFMAALTVALCFALCAQTLTLYRRGNRPENFSAPGVRIEPVYSRALAGQCLRRLSPLLGVYTVALVFALVLEKKRAQAEPPRALRFAADRLRSFAAKGAQPPAGAAAERQKRRRIALGAGAALLLCAAMSAAYLLNGAHFASWELESVMGALLLHVLPWVAAGFAVLYAADAALDLSRRREATLWQAARPQAAAGTPAATGTQPAAPARRRPLWARAALYVLAVSLIALGVLNGGLRDVLIKAINICTECIGLG